MEKNAPLPVLTPVGPASTNGMSSTPHSNAQVGPVPILRPDPNNDVDSKAESAAVESGTTDSVLPAVVSDSTAPNKGMTTIRIFSLPPSSNAENNAKEPYYKVPDGMEKDPEMIRAELLFYNTPETEQYSEQVYQSLVNVEEQCAVDYKRYCYSFGTAENSFVDLNDLVQPSLLFLNASQMFRRSLTSVPSSKGLEWVNYFRSFYNPSVSAQLTNHISAEAASNSFGRQSSKPNVRSTLLINGRLQAEALKAKEAKLTSELKGKRVNEGRRLDGIREHARPPMHPVLTHHGPPKPVPSTEDSPPSLPIEQSPPSAVSPPVPPAGPEFLDGPPLVPPGLLFQSVFGRMFRPMIPISPAEDLDNRPELPNEGPPPGFAPPGLAPPPVLGRPEPPRMMQSGRGRGGKGRDESPPNPPRGQHPPRPPVNDDDSDDDHNRGRPGRGRWNDSDSDSDGDDDDEKPVFRSSGRRGRRGGPPPNPWEDYSFVGALGFGAQGDMCMYNNFDSLSSSCKSAISDVHQLREEYWSNHVSSTTHYHHHSIIMPILALVGLVALVKRCCLHKRHKVVKDLLKGIHADPELKKTVESRLGMVIPEPVQCVHEQQGFCKRIMTFVAFFIFALIASFVITITSLELTSLIVSKMDENASSEEELVGPNTAMFILFAICTAQVALLSGLIYKLKRRWLQRRNNQQTPSAPSLTAATAYSNNISGGNDGNGGHGLRYIPVRIRNWISPRWQSLRSAMTSFSISPQNPDGYASLNGEDESTEMIAVSSGINSSVHNPHRYTIYTGTPLAPQVSHHGMPVGVTVAPVTAVPVTAVNFV